MKKKILTAIGGLLAALLAVGVVGTTSAYAQGPNPPGRGVMGGGRGGFGRGFGGQRGGGWGLGNGFGFGNCPQVQP